MKISPSHPYQTDSYAELLVFDKIREAFTNESGFFAFHSLNLTKHETKRFGEVDFVVVCKFGVFSFEVKGGSGLSYENGQFSTHNKRGKFPIQDPFRQAETALHAIKKEVHDSNAFHGGFKYCIGYGVVFPQLEWNIHGSEWDRHTICDIRNFRNFEAWLKNLFHYWQNKPGNRVSLSVEQVKKLATFLRPDFELIEPLYSVLSQLDEAASSLTEDQYMALDLIEANPRVLCSGGAGTGKTFLAAELGRRLASTNRLFLLVCKSGFLKSYLETRILNEFIIISTIDGLGITMRRHGIDQFDGLIIDEGQDLFGLEEIEKLDAVLKGGLENGNWYIFHDINNQSGLFIDERGEILDLLISYGATNAPLKTNCRNTKNILTSVQKRLGLDMGVTGTGHGPEVKEIIANTGQNEAEVLSEQLEELRQKRVPHQSITILSPNSYNNSSARQLPESQRRKIKQLDEYSIRDFPIPEISFSEIKNFKGLENDVIILVDMPVPQNFESERQKVLYYVAMSRAKSLLVSIWKG